MTFAAAQQYVMPFGQYKGQTLDHIASTDTGLRYLDWFAEECYHIETMNALSTYLSDPSIKKELDHLMRS